MDVRTRLVYMELFGVPDSKADTPKIRGIVCKLRRFQNGNQKTHNR
jgi:hypothetical protein